jgi:hypothetical protein
MAAQWTLTEDTRYLSCRGFIFDSVHTISTSLSENLPYGTEVSRKPEAFHPLTNLSPPNRYGDKAGVRTALWRTLRQDHPSRRYIEKTCLDIRWFDWSVLESDLENGFLPNISYSMRSLTSHVSWKTFESFRQSNTKFQILGAEMRSYFSEMDPWSGFWGRDESKDPEYAELLNQMAFDMHLVVLTLNRRRLVTTSGGYLGLAPEEVRKGDVIAVLYGCNFPVVLRPCGNGYLVIGECYIDDVMDGELIEAKDRGEFEERDIILC